MSTIKSSDEHLTLNADGSSKDIKFQANGVEKASISSAGAFTSTTIDATKLTGNLPAISGANLTGVGVAGISSSADATAITITSDEDVGIGTATPHTDAWGSAGNNTQLAIDGTTGYGVLHLRGTGGGSTNTKFSIGVGDDTLYLAYDEVDGAHRITVDGNGKSRFTKGVTPAVIDSSNSFEFLFAGSSDAGMSIASTGNSNATGFLNFRRSTTTLIGHINRNGTSDAVNYNTSSDYRLKENIANITDGITRVKQLTPRRFSWKSDSDSTMQDGFIAHEIDSIVTHAVSGTKDAVKTLNKVVVNTEDDIIAFDIEEADWTTGKETGQYPSDSTWANSKTQIIPQALDYGTVTPLLTAALQEAIAKIEALEARVAALEA